MRSFIRFNNESNRMSARPCLRFLLCAVMRFTARSTANSRRWLMLTKDAVAASRSASFLHSFMRGPSRRKNGGDASRKHNAA